LTLQKRNLFPCDLKNQEERGTSLILKSEEGKPSYSGSFDKLLRAPAKAVGQDDILENAFGGRAITLRSAQHDILEKERKPHLIVILSGGVSHSRKIWGSRGRSPP